MAAPSRSLQAWLVLLPVGAVLGTLFDQIHVQLGVLSYPTPHPWLLGQAWWVPLLFLVVGVLLVSTHAVIRPAAESVSWRRLLATTALFIAAYTATGLFKATPRLLALGLLVAWAVRVALRPARDAVLSSLAIALGGTLFELWLSSTGAFVYGRHDVLAVPSWLPTLYLHAALLSRDIYLKFYHPDRPAPARPA